MGDGRLNRLNRVLVVLVALHNVLLVHSVIPPHRKTFGIGPAIPHARFEPLPIDVTGDDTDSKDAYMVARDFLSQYDDPQSGRTYAIRPNSYVDTATGITHVYARQIVGGLEVANAHVNLNIKDSRVYSFGDSFFPGQVEPHSDARAVHVHKKRHCAQLSSALGVQRSFLHLLLDADDRARLARGLVDLEHIHDLDCVDAVNSSSPSSSSSKFVRPTEIDVDPRRALLTFLAFALPESHPEYESLQEHNGDHLERHMSNIIMIPEMHVLGEERASVGMSLSSVPGVLGEVKTHIVWMQVPDRHGMRLKLVHRFEVEMEHNWYEATISISTPHKIVGVVDWVNDSPMPKGAALEERQDTSQPPKPNDVSYLVFPWGTNDPVDAAQKKAASNGQTTEAEYPLAYGREIVRGLADTLASPVGWHTLPFSYDPSIQEEEKLALAHVWHTTNTTWGNNVFAQRNWEGGQAWIDSERPFASADGTFSYPYSPEAMDSPSKSLGQAKSYVDASVTQLFYTINMIHDLFYRYGFTEVAGNFQQYNFGRGGEEEDAVIADAQRGDGFNNAAFASPPDGQNGRCSVFLWDTGSPYADGAMDAGIVIHELSHGLSMRLTGGPKNSGCLGWGESRGMGEGWGDFMALTVRSTATYSDYPLGAWSSNSKGGVRHYPYSTRTSVNPLTYESLDKLELLGVHAIGEIWAEMLWVVQQRLIAKHGFSDTLFPPVPNTDRSLPVNSFYRETTDSSVSTPILVPQHGNTLMLQLVVNGMKMQPCSPSFFDARDAFIEADRVLTGGENMCDIWAGFAERGLGKDAQVIDGEEGKHSRQNGFDIPAECRSKVSVGTISEIRARYENVLLPPTITIPPTSHGTEAAGGKLVVDPPKVTTVLFADSFNFH